MNPGTLHVPLAVATQPSPVWAGLQKSQGLSRKLYSALGSLNLSMPPGAGVAHAGLAGQEQVVHVPKIIPQERAKFFEAPRFAQAAVQVWGSVHPASAKKSGLELGACACEGCTGHQPPQERIVHQHVEQVVEVHVPMTQDLFGGLLGV